MKLIRSTMIAMSSAALGTYAHAQSNLTLYGTLDNGISYVHNSGGNSSQWKMNPGGLSGNSWGMTGWEDLGGGIGALFKLESNFSGGNGTMGNGGKLFGAKAYVGLGSSTWGSILLGRQNDPLSMLVAPLTADSFSGATAPPGDIDSFDGSMNFSNVVKWISPNWRGLTVQVMATLGGVAGAAGSGSAYAAAANYSRDALGVAAGFMHVDNGNARLGERGVSTADSIFNSAVNSAYASAHAIDILRMAGSYMIGGVTVGLAASFSEYTPDAASSFRVAEKYVNVGTFGRWQLNPAFYAITAYNYTASSGDSSARYHQVNFGLDYLLSKRTDLYVSTAYQHASGRNGLGAAQAVIGSNDVNSGASSQVLVDIGMRHRF
ncbi:porin [Burkholderia multivorans]|uniref:porin n=1 Tax=Burkholderia multivorans TaxID=87883 RepID=UPI001C227FBE|nr:porin [Burkholderia multivorans]MBU9220156.1 porin [Burkholderia multivorans]MBU9417930.1 porin [Burkholderia multivorans]MBU9477712.1 porin [Burkholderia multivorans]